VEQLVLLVLLVEQVVEAILLLVEMFAVLKHLEEQAVQVLH
tara:strand:- start:250 stop:372 length:123 start_codon:yes stop_codon:yes gene_type:complete